ncbi:MAG: hypothetical protein UW62_C0026G0004 [Candidatus Collierbacteria bacterium GW2011_GWB1_44_35]|uniref:DUF4174 domain-containing protein n=5 Tax=Candidatus Collieribacteriota TaxID=1752725 RepID=A0A0G1HJ40_9BACT|nr:MAG: hypothetical protein UW23_C0014G0017 [Candidatus Collierbacteria bacterium GW2011_GWA1_44_12]KKT37034.1 MAG: hypothetical protein UW26_C0039G0009 [Candidatus Collierbacteria bacterium GW2011_GWF1_44_12]KKT46955.1 MAG: hypothetical protein UW35_C0005G0032 [Candidatus Collierbacteria bacterium GW2011_GWF2_44_15]KKT67363.1 MAG: hypothetical protein UW62_C0026G0004 [Candidatus Collierbacteria bacterium GW2011_GWB1_44_35]KKT97720.1 MAG: hypothetical protein UW99_C0029G0010 [Candidatus Collie
MKRPITFVLITLLLVILLREPVSRVLGGVSVEIGPPNYLNYSKEEFNSHSDKVRAVCFMAEWDAYDEKVDSEIRSSEKRIPTNTIIFKADFDKELDLKKQYSIYIKHECLIFDSQGGVSKRVNPEKILSILSLQ